MLNRKIANKYVVLHARSKQNAIIKRKKKNEIHFANEMNSLILHHLI